MSRAWHYSAIDAEGHRRRGWARAAAEPELERLLAGQGLGLLRARRVWAAWLVGPCRAGRARPVGAARLLDLLFHLEHLLRAGVPMFEALDDLAANLDTPAQRASAARLREAVGSGASLSAAMEAQPAVYGALVPAVVRAGELSGRLEALLQALREGLKWQHEQAARARRLLLYPLAMTVFLAAILAVLMAWLVPELSRFLTLTGAELPWHSRALFALAGWLGGQAWLLPLLPLLLLLLRAALRAHPACALATDRVLLALPLAGPLQLHAALSRFIQCLALLYEAGLTLPECLDSAAGVLGNRALRAAVGEAGGHIARGAQLSTAFEAAGLFPDRVVRMLRLGESTGTLGVSLRELAAFHARRLEQGVSRLQGLAGPLSSLLVGGLLGWIMLSVLGPVYELLAGLGF